MTVEPAGIVAGLDTGVKSSMTARFLAQVIRRMKMRAEVEKWAGSKIIGKMEAQFGTCDIPL